MVMVVWVLPQVLKAKYTTAIRQQDYLDTTVIMKVPLSYMTVPRYP